MLTGAEMARFDSRTMRIASIVALIYLPVSLVSVSLYDTLQIEPIAKQNIQSFFSSNIVQLASRDIASPTVEMQKEAGFFVAVTVLLTGFTAAVTIYWERSERMSVVRRQNIGSLTQNP